jgi:hypothetical protein
MAETTSHLGADRPLLRGICLVVKGDRAAGDQNRGSNRDRSPDRRKRSGTSGTVAEFPRRPDCTVLSETIPFFFIGRNKRGLWIVREAEGRTGGIFIFKKSALRFAARASAPIGYATMLLAERFELDIENRGNPLAAWLDKALRNLAGLIPAYPPPIPIERRNVKWERR